MESKDKLEPTQIPSEIDINYRRASDYRILKVDGAWAGITPQLDIQFALYNDLQPMPTRIRHKVTPEGALSPIEVERDVETGIAREVVTTIVMNPIVAIQFVALLQRLINQATSDMEEATEKPKQETKSGKSD